MTIREINLDDGDRLFDFYLSLSDEVAMLYLPETPVTYSAIEVHLETIAQGTAIGLALVDAEDTIMGHAFLHRTDTRSPMVGIGLRDSVIGQGYGRRMMERLLEIADTLGLRRTALCVVKGNVRAETLYLSLGYSRIGECSFRGHNDCWLMERILPRRGNVRRDT